MTIINGSTLLRAAPLSPMLATKERAHGVSHGLAEARVFLTQVHDSDRKRQGARCLQHQRAPNHNRSRGDRVMAKGQLRPARAERQQFPGIAWERTCKKCGVSRPETEEFFYPHAQSRRGLLAKCKECVNQENKESFERRFEREPEKVRAQSCERTKRHYYRDLEEGRRKSRESAARARQDPERRARINMRKRGGGAGLTPEDFERMFEAQGRKCAICEATEPGAKTGWNIDHCHKANEVRFILCPHCNRGLGAFKDSPAVMRRAADILERWQEGKDE